MLHNVLLRKYFKFTDAYPSMGMHSTLYFSLFFTSTNYTAMNNFQAYGLNMVCVLQGFMSWDLGPLCGDAGKQDL